MNNVCTRKKINYRVARYTTLIILKISLNFTNNSERIKLLIDCKFIINMQKFKKKQTFYTDLILEILRFSIFLNKTSKIFKMVLGTFSKFPRGCSPLIY